MKVLMLEVVQGRDIEGIASNGDTVKVLEVGQGYTVSQSLGVWLVGNGKAQEVKDAPHYGAQPEPELRNDEAKAEEMQAAEGETPGEYGVLPEFSQDEKEAVPVQSTKSKRGRKS